MATATGSRQPRRPKHEPVTNRAQPQTRRRRRRNLIAAVRIEPRFATLHAPQRARQKRGLRGPFLSTRLVHFQVASWHNLSPPLTIELTGKCFDLLLVDDVGSARKALHDLEIIEIEPVVVAVVLHGRVSGPQQALKSPSYTTWTA